MLVIKMSKNDKILSIIIFIIILLCIPIYSFYFINNVISFITLFIQVLLILIFALIIPKNKASYYIEDNKFKLKPSLISAILSIGFITVGIISQINTKNSDAGLSFISYLEALWFLIPLFSRSKIITIIIKILGN